MDRTLRIGIVGAGTNTREKHIPGLRAIPGVEIVAVANRTLASSQRAAEELGIPRAHANWLDLVEDDEVDAVVIGTWPYMHFPVTVAALEHGKHVLCEARMALDAEEARAMLEVSRSRPELVAQVVPAPHTLVVDGYIQELLAQGFLGELLAVEVAVTQADFVEADGALHWRQNRDYSGLNTLAMGIWYEALMRWVGPASRVQAITRTFATHRRDERGHLVAVTVPDHVDVLADLAGRAVAHLRFSAVTGLHARNDVYLYGTLGTLHWDGLAQTLHGGKAGEQALHPLPIPARLQGRWRVEEEFVNAIRGEEPVRLTRFEDGVRYMEFTEAVIRSAQEGRAVPLPLLA